MKNQKVSSAWGSRLAVAGLLAQTVACSANDVGDGRTLRGTDASVVLPDVSITLDTGPTSPPDMGVTPDGGFEDTGIAPIEPFPNATVGRRCGTGDTQQFIVLSAVPASCARHAQLLDAWDGTPVAFAVLPETSGQVEVTATVCLDAQGCQQLPITFSFDGWTESSGAAGRWGFDLPNGGRAQGEFDAGWCEYDEFLPGGADGRASNIAITDVEVLQGTTVKIVDNAEPVAPADRNAAVVQERAALVRVYVRPLADFFERDLVARLTLDLPGRDPVVLEQRHRIAGASNAELINTTFNFEVEASEMASSLEWNVGLFETAVCSAPLGDTDQSRYPRDGSFELMNGRSTGGSLDITLVRVRYNGSVPDTSPGVVQGYRERLEDMFPVSEVAINVREGIFDWNQTVNTTAQWSALLDGLRTLRASDNPPRGTYYYGLIDAGGEAAGIAFRITNPNTASSRVGVGQDISRPGSANTMAHELGHNHGRGHSPCGNAPGPDPSYPYPDCELGVIGYSLMSGDLFRPTVHNDIMGYARPYWISDWTFDAIFERVAAVNNASPLLPWAERRVRVAISVGDSAFWGQPAVIREPVEMAVRIQLEDAAGNVVAVEEADERQISDAMGSAYYITDVDYPGAVQVRLPDGRVLPW